MEYGNFLQFILPSLVGYNNTNFRSYINNTPQLLYWYADFLMYTLPNPRYSFYESPNFEQIQNKVTEQTNLVTEALGFY